MGLKQLEKLMGSINDLGQMCQSVKYHRREGNALLGQFRGDYHVLKMIPGELKKELRVLSKIAESTIQGLPLAEEPGQPSLSTLVFYTDAAGASFSLHKGERVFHNNENKGVVCIRGESISNIWCWCKLEWPKGLLTHQVDEKGRHFGCKFTTLEAIGMLLPFLAFPDKVSGKNVVFKIDNMAVLFGWYSGFVKNNKTASEVLKSVHYLSGLAGTTVNVEHVDRMSSEMAALADELSRREFSQNEKAACALKKSEKRSVNGYILEWLKNPSGESCLHRRLLKEMGINST